MKKTLAVLAITLMIGTSGCGTCRGLRGRACRPAAGPILSRIAAPRCAPVCAPACGPTCNSGGVYASDASCGCETGNRVTYGFDGGEMYYPGNVETLPAGNVTSEE